jgi:hypothetical protein
VSRVEPLSQTDTSRVGSICTREAASHETQLGGLRPYCFFKASALMHASAVHGRKRFS